MRKLERFLSPSEAAERLGVSTKALRLYEQHGLIKPIRTAAGWRTYGTAQIARGAEIAALRALGLSLAQTGRVLCGERDELEPALAAHQAALESRIRELAATTDKVRKLRVDLAQGRAPTIDELARLVRPTGEARLAFDLPWPWGAERFELRDIAPLNYLVGPLGSGKTRLARAIAEHLQGAMFVGLDRLTDAGANGETGPDASLAARVARTLRWLAEDGAEVTPALTALVSALEVAGPPCFVVDMVEQGLNHGTQQALIAYLRRRGLESPPLFLMTRSNVILDLAAVGPDERIILCPANHSAPIRVLPHSGAPGYEAVATCLASPEVRARTEGVAAVRLTSPARV